MWVKDGANGASPDYVYDNDGNVVIDLNKNAKDLGNVTGANGIRYNYLDKPDQIRIAGKGTINIVYSADGEKLQRIFTPETGPATTTTYINQFVYQATGANPDVLSYINFEEGRIRVITPTSQNNGYDLLTVDGNMDLPNSKKGAYDYFILDYQQNVRMILTEETHVASNTATMETARASIEDAIFGQTGGANEVETTRFATPAAWTSNATASVSRLGNTAGHNVGPNTLQKVMAGDVVNANVQYYYNQSASGYNPAFVNNLLSSLLNTLTNGPTSNLVKGGASNITNGLGSNLPFTSAIQPSTNTGTTPLAYLTVLFFDERFNFIDAADGGVYQQQVASSVGSSGSSIPLPNIKAPKNGYVYVYVSNQSNQDVYFDNMAVSIAQGNIIEENHYYSFGLKIAAISSKKMADSYDGDIKNNYGMQGAFSEMDDDIAWNDFDLRNYDPQIGRWAQIDPYADNYISSPYAGMGNDPVNIIDPSGGIYIAPLQKALTTGVQAASTVTKVAVSTLQVVTQTASVIVKTLEGIRIVSNVAATEAVGNAAPDNEYDIIRDNSTGTITVVKTGTKGGAKTDYITYKEKDYSIGFPRKTGYEEVSVKMVTGNRTIPSSFERVPGYFINHPSLDIPLGNDLVGEAFGAWVLGKPLGFALGKVGGFVGRRVGLFAVEGGTAGVQITLHGAKRVAGAAATRGGVLSVEGINTTKTLGRAFTQGDGATVFLHEVTPGRFNAVVQGNNGIITTMENWSQKSINRIAKNYGWKLE